MRPFLICNPGARSRRGATAAEAYRSLLDRRGVPHECAFTEEMDDATRLAREAASGGFDPVVAVGGDGTINRVLNGLLEYPAREGSASLGVLYAGTSPDFCRFHGLPVGGEDAVDALLSRPGRHVDLCRLRFHDAGGAEKAMHFACSANLGLGPDVAAWANAHRRHLGDLGGTLAALLLALFKGRRFRGTAVVDGERRTLSGIWNLTIGKNPRIASGLKLSVDVEPRDGRLFLFALHGTGRWGLLRRLPSAYTGAIARDPRFTLLVGSRAEFRCEGDEAGLETDGDPAGFGPVTVEVLPRALKLAGARP